MIEYIFPLNKLKDTQHIASIIAKTAKVGDTITLSGNLGVGKTSFIQFFVNSLAEKPIEVTSPTFNLLNIYNLNDLEIWHFDLYRLKNKEEVYELGIEDAYSEGISLIEWPEIIANILPKNRLEIIISFSNEIRILTLRAFGRWEKINYEDLK